MEPYVFENGEIPIKPAQPVEPWVPEYLPLDKKQSIA